MNRWLASGVAFLVGLSGSFAAVSASEDPTTPLQGDLLGPVDFDLHCDSVAGERSVAVADSASAYGWSCAQRKNGLFSTIPADYDEACALQFGEPSFPRPWDDELAGSWECFYGEAD
jgi:hypothetical protein